MWRKGGGEETEVNSEKERDTRDREGRVEVKWKREREREGACEYRKMRVPPPSAHLSSCNGSQMLKGLEVTSLASSSQESPSDGILDSK